ncbi:DUF4139 domain-containing protein [Mucilaginibacter sp. L196]|uniref:DUF4139 domain-containing protein n=1 Tax=Mucilaginibacter sp. L196 TaxID=1641870 RepID=UPI00131CC81B|nr:DUF4139 domain-containing protein [Mucilaginibacter sp. L196]
MFKKLLIIGLIFTAINSRADDGQKVTSKVQKVIVFLNGAQVTRNASVNISPGTSTLVFGGISSGIDAQSIQVHAGGDFTILSVKNELNYLNADNKEKDIAALQVQQKLLKDKLQLQNNLLSISQQEEQMLFKNQMVVGQNSTFDVLKLKQALDFQTERLTEIKKRQLVINSDIEAINTELQKYNSQIYDLQRGSSTVTSNILVTVSAEKSLQTEFTLNYVVRNARWYPSYDIKAKNVNSPLSVSYKANVSQQSGEDWKNIKLSLSTGNPAISGSKPELNPYYLNFDESSNRQADYASSSVSNNELAEVVVTKGYGTQQKEYSNPVMVNQVDNQTNVEFKIDNPYSIPSDGKQYTVQIQQFDLPATYQYAIAPKLSTNVFLSAKITDWNKYNFLSGEANLFFEDTFIGKSALNINSTSDTLNLSLGADKNIVVTRVLQKEITQRQTIGSNRKDTRDWLIEIKNRKKQPINLLVEDQIPVSQNTAIEVETQELSHGSLDPNTGKVSWNIKLSPQDSKKLELKYQVKYPKNQSIIIQ